MGNAPTENFPDYEVLNGSIEAAKRNQQSASDATKILRDAVEMFENKIPLPHYAVLNALIEAAKRNQRAAERATQDLSAAIMTLQGQTSNLPNTLVEPVVNKLLPKLKDEFRAVTEEAERRDADSNECQSICMVALSHPYSLLLCRDRIHVHLVLHHGAARRTT